MWLGRPPETGVGLAGARLELYSGSFCDTGAGPLATTVTAEDGSFALELTISEERTLIVTETNPPAGWTLPPCAEFQEPAWE